MFVRTYNLFVSGNLFNGRLRFWSLSLELFLQNPLFGIGWGQFQMISACTASTLHAVAHVHNVYLQLLCESGIFGFLFYVCWFIFSYYKTIKVFLINKELDSKANFYLIFSLCFQTFFLLYCFSGNPLYVRDMFLPYFMMVYVILTSHYNLKSPFSYIIKILIKKKL